MEEAEVNDVASSYLTTEEAAGVLRVQPRTLAAWRSLGKGPVFHKQGGVVRYRLSEIEDWLEGRIGQ